ncbi:hypothetical protein ONO38_21880, partial [Salmonella enterica subsp. enterica serovar Lubbock]|nr:hypothetical protein [Salmonella enterica subsp. enterica serovar Lubbock]
LAEAFSTIMIQWDGKVVGSANANANGEWSWTPPSVLAPGSYVAGGCASSCLSESGLTTGCRQAAGSRRCPRLRKSEQQKRHNRKMPHTMTGRKGSAAGAALLHFRQA